MATFWLLFLSALNHILHVVLAGDPISIPWNRKESFGPDGPWQAVQLQVGASNLSLYPGGNFASCVFNTDLCKDGASNCTVAQAGLYDASASPTKDDWSTLSWGTVGEWGSDLQMNLTSSGSLLFDDISFRSADAQAHDIRAKRMLLWSLSSQTVRKPLGSTYSQRVAGFAFGGPAPNYSVGVNGTENVTAVPFSSYLKQNQGIPSNSLGLHVGSVRHNIPGSLIMGGYDRNRAIGPVVSGNLVQDGVPVLPLVGVSLGTGDNTISLSSPLNVTETPNLLSTAQLQGFNVLLTPAVPYIALPHRVCAALADYLPVTYNLRLGLYLWQTDDPRYAALMASRAELRFAFADSLTANVTIAVPLALLNLTLEAPLADPPAPYFPCQPLDAVMDEWTLGRAFLQAAYLGLHWDRGQYLVAQAPGPGFNGSADVVAFEPDEARMSTAPATSYAASWEKVWTGGSGASNGSATSRNASSGGTAKLKTGSIVAIVIGSVAGASLIAAAAVWLVPRRRRRRALTAASDAGWSKAAELSPGMKQERFMAAVYPADRKRMLNETDGQSLHEAGRGSLYEADRRSVCEADGRKVDWTERKEVFEAPT